MSDDDSGKYRKRFEDEGGEGLTRYEDLLVRPEVGGITLKKLAEGALEDAFEFTALADQMTLPGEDQDEGDDSLPDFGIGSLVKRQLSERCSELLERARVFISSKQHRQALSPLEEALTVDPRCDEAMAMKIHSLAELGHYEAAVRSISLARSRIENPELRAQILRLESRCIRAETRVLEERLGKLVAERKYDEAIVLIQEGLRRQPSNIVFLYHLANLHWVRGDKEQARLVAEEARRHVGRENVDLIAELERKIGLGDHRSTVDGARLALRRGDAAHAIELLDSCRELEGNEHYDGLRSYAEEKRRGGLGRLFGAKSLPPQGAERRQTLRWLLTEEFKASEEAQRADRFSDSRKALEDAAKLEPACLAVSFRHANVIVAQYRRAVEKKSAIDFDTALKDLALAESLATSVAADADFAVPAVSLIQSIRMLHEKLSIKKKAISKP